MSMTKEEIYNKVKEAVELCFGDCSMEELPDFVFVDGPTLFCDEYTSCNGLIPIHYTFSYCKDKETIDKFIDRVCLVYIEQIKALNLRLESIY